MNALSDNRLADAAHTFGFTFGMHTHTNWTDRRRLIWPELAELLTRHEIGHKEGACIVPATFRGERRHKADADKIDAVFLDSDSGATLEEITAAVRLHGWAAIVSSTHSHLTTVTKAKRSNWDKFLAECPIGAEAAFLTETKGMLPRVAEGATIDREQGEFIYLRHQPCPKFRVVLPLHCPWRAADHASQDAANAVWKERIEALAAALGLSHDQSCTDTSRLFYLPRRPADGPPAETAIIEGGMCDIFALAAPEIPLSAAAAGTAGGTRARAESLDDQEFGDPATGEVIDLRRWARERGEKFLIAAALRARRPAALTGRVADRVKVHIRCPNEAAHTEPGQDGATFVTDAGQASNKGFVIHCRHGHCDGKDRLFFVRRMLCEGWLSIGDLTDPAFLLGAGGNHTPSAAEEWGDPVDFLGDADMTGAPELKPEHLPDALAPFVFDTAARMGVDPAAVALCAIVSCSAVTSDDWSIQPKRHDDTWLEQARLWGAIVGDPSILKTPVLKAATRPVDKLDMEARKRHDAAMQRYMAELAAWKKGKQEGDEPKHPVLDRYMVESLTVEALSEVLRDDFMAKQRAPAGKVLVRSDELSELLGNLDRYNAGGRGGGDRGAYLRLFNGGRHTVDRIGRGAFACPNWSASIVGGIQPGPIQRIARDAADDGMLQRFLYCVPAGQGGGLDRAPDRDALKRYEGLVQELSELRPKRASAFQDALEVVRLDPDAQQHREALDSLVTALKAMPDTTARMKAALGKFPGIYARLCLLFHLIDIADAKTDSRVVPEPTARRAMLYLRDVLLPHLQRAEAVMYLTTQTGHARWIAGFILSRGFNRVTRRDITRAYGDLRAPECARELTSVMAGLEAMAWVRVEDPDNPARMPAGWFVNPRVHAVFAERAEQERQRRKQALAATTEIIRAKVRGEQ